ncbi:MAG: hypothetical protein ACOC41_00575 [Chitinivibrionales bacterium]
MAIICDNRIKTSRLACVISVALITLFTGCSKQIMKPASYETDAAHEEKLVHRAPGDTLSWVVEFPDSLSQEHFLDSFDRFLAQYRTDTIQTDTISHYFHLRMLGVRKPDTDTALSFGIIDKPSFSEGDIEGDFGFADTVHQDSAEAIRKQIPFGGSVTIYAQKDFIDDELSSLVSANPVITTPDDPQQIDPFTAQDRPRDERGHGEMFQDEMVSQDSLAGSVQKSQKPEGYIRIEQLSPRKLRLSFVEGVVDGKGQAPGSFDLVDAWTTWIKKHPAEGLALFKNVQGLQAFIHGREAVIPGFQVADERSVIILLDTPDPEAITRLSSSRLLPLSMKMGPYFIKEAKNNKLHLAPNDSFFRGKPYLQSASLVLNGDNNPFISYSLNKYDMMILTYVKDLNYARRSLPSSSLFPYAQSRYFLSVAHPDYQVRRYLQAIIDADDILAGTARVEGSVIRGIADTTLVVSRPEPNAADAQYINEPLNIIYRSDDPFSVSIAEKILADLAQSDIPSSLKGLKATDYEKALINSSYDIAIGWVSQKVVNDQSEQLRLATMWFRDHTDEAHRYEQGWEIPLFSITRYVLCKPEIHFADNRLTEMYIQTEQ